MGCSNWVVSLSICSTREEDLSFLEIIKLALALSLILDSGPWSWLSACSGILSEPAVEADSISLWAIRWAP